MEPHLQRFEQSRQTGPVDIRQFLQTCPQALQQDLLIELIAIDLGSRWKLDTRQVVSTLPDTPRSVRLQLEDYLAQFPELGSFDDLPLELICREYRVRNLWGDHPTHEHFRQRFPNHPQLVERLPQIDAELAQQQESQIEATQDVATRSPSLSRTTPHQGSTPQHLPKEFGRYKILRVLGKGGMGAVYLAEDPQLERQVAIKVPFDDDSVDNSIITRFHREAKSAAALRHPNICPIYEVAQINGIHYLAMAYIDGHPLSKFIKKDQHQPIKTVITLILKLALALEEAHKKGIIHRDLKPANIMIDRRKEPIIMDFGLARKEGHADENLTQAGQILGNCLASYPPRGNW